MGRRPGIFRAPLSGPFGGILAEPLADDCGPADIAARFAPLFKCYAIAPPGLIDGWPLEGEERARSPWERLARELAYDLMPCMYTARRVGRRPHKRTFSDRDAIIFYALFTAEYTAVTMNARARIVAKRLGEENPVKIKNRYQTLRRRERNVRVAMLMRGEELARPCKSDATIQS